MANQPVITTSYGVPVDDNQTSITAGPKGPVLLEDFHLIDKLAHFDRERIPERVVHAKGAGAHGYFEVTHDITKYCKAKIFEGVGRKTPCFARFSTVGGEKGSADTARDPRGFSVKFYTEEGNWDFVGNNTPVFFIRDAIKFPDFIHTQKRNPQTNLKDADMFWDFLSLTPESCHQLTILFSDRGTPDGYRHMNGYSSHSYKIVNKAGEVFYVKMHFKTDQGIKNLSGSEAHRLESDDPDYATRDLFNAIDANKPPSWTLYFQIIPEAEALNYRFNVLDITKVVSHKDYPLIPVGKLVLNKNPENYFQDVEQSAFSPGHLVPGIEPSEDKMLQGRLFSYPDTHRHRLGPNYHQIPINRPITAASGRYNLRDGPMCIDGNNGALPNYEPNSIEGTPKENPIYKRSSLKVNDNIQKFRQYSHDDDFIQAGILYSKVMDEGQRSALISNLVGHLKNARPDIQERQIRIFGRCDPDYGKRLADALGFKNLSSSFAKL